MNTFDNQNRICFHFQSVAALNSLSADKVKPRQLYLCSRKQFLHLIVEKVQLQRLYALKIVVSRSIFGRMFPIDKVIVQRNLQRLEPEHRKLGCNSPA